MKIILSCFFLLLILVPLSASSIEKKVYVVYFGEHNGEKALHEIEETHKSYLHSVKDSEEDAESSLVYSYKHSINGFAAKLTPDEASKLSEMEEVVSVIPSHPGKYSVQTTRSWEFVGLDESEGKSSWNKLKMGGDEDLLSKAKYGKDVIIGVMDSGVWPESPSFSDKGMGRIPKSWKGICQEGVAFNSSHCNRKIIGARYYVKGFESGYGRPVNATEDCLSPRDMDGHGTHTASTAAGRQVFDVAALGGFAKGTASGGAPLARLAIYKACWAIPNQPKADGNTCFAEDMLAAMDDAIADGVDILSVSIGTAEPLPYNHDIIGLGALHAARHNILVVCSAGNSGPAPGTLSNPAPWIITVGASSLDRVFSAPVILGNGLEIIGQSVTPYKLKDKTYPLIKAGDVVVPGVAQNLTEQCLPGSLDPDKVKGKIVMCTRGAGLRVGKGIEVKRAGGVGFILANSQGNELSCDAHLLPATAVTSDGRTKILEYINSTKNPMAMISPAKTVLHYRPAPFMAGFSSQGPNVVDPNILKPDITAPGLNILAAWSEASSPTRFPEDHRSVKYNIFSGTSMSCPHVSGAAALLRAIHPDWSIAAIKSALMTTSSITNNLGKRITDAAGNIATPFQFGSGHFRPIKAADPGLIYDSSYHDYLLYLCSVGPKILKNIDSTFKCPNKPPSSVNLNYPSFAISNLNTTYIITRTVTNVGRCNSKYLFKAKPPPGVRVKASPAILYFDQLGQKKSFNITVSPRNDPKMKKSDYGFGWYTWTDGHYRVRSPMAVYLP
ncbi:hypothetical protein PTKIN_Ptkin01aG0096300 [Pterospermum kingtungense]